MLGPAGLQIVGNLLVNFKALSAEQTRELYVCVTGSPSRSASQIDAVSLVAAVVGAHKKTVRKWSWDFENRCGLYALDKRCQSVLPHDVPATSVDSHDEMQVPAFGGEMHMPAFGGEVQLQLPAVSSVAEDDDTDVEVCEPLGLPPVDMAKYKISIRLAEVAVMWNVNGWSRALFPRFMLWARERFPNQLGNLNHSERFINGFLPDLVGIVHQRISGSLHTLVPALGIPSLLSRVIDIVSINGRSLLPTIHIYTAPSGKLQWFLLGVSMFRIL